MLMTTLLLALATAATAVAAVSGSYVLPKGLSIRDRLSVLWIPLAVAALSLAQGTTSAPPTGLNLISFALGTVVLARFVWHMIQLRRDLQRAGRENANGN